MPGQWQAGDGYPNDPVMVTAAGEVVLQGVSPAEDDQAANAGPLGGRDGLSDLMEAIEDIDGMPFDGNNGEDGAKSGSDDEAAAGADAEDSNEIIDDFLNPTNCFICTEPIQFHALGSCNHRVCHVCSLRLRALYKVRSCAYCKRELDKVIFTRSSDRPFKSFSNRKEAPFEDRKLAIRFEDREVFEDTMVLLRFNCPEPTCDVACPGGWRELKKHVKDAHSMMLCDICARHKKIFTHEHQLFTASSLQQHYRGTDPADPSFRGHPECGFCHSRFYGDDELWEHCRDRHEECFICVRRGIRHRYYLDYTRLAEHFGAEHYACRNATCLEQKFVVFENEIDLKAHEVEVHGAAEKKKPGFRKVELDLAPRRPPSQERRPSPGPLYQPQSAPQPSPQSAFPPLSGSAPAASAAQDDERQRRLRPPPGFGSQLTPSAQVQPAAQAAAAAEIPAALQRIFGNDPRKYTEFRSLAQAYKGSLVSADEFVRSVVGLATEGLSDERALKEKEAEVGRVWIRMAETAPDGPPGRGGVGRKEEMLRAWKDYKVSRTHFPDLPAPSGPGSSGSDNRTSYSSTANPRVATANSAAAADRARVLVIKSNARKHTFPAVPSQPKRSVYDRIAEEAEKRMARDERAEEEREERELLQRAAGEGSSAPQSRVKVMSREEFAEQRAIAESARMASAPSASWRKEPSVRSAQDFPSLPAASKPPKIARPGTPSNAWSAQAPESGESDQGPADGEGKKSKKKSKQVLMKIGL
ncbi:hypothetical protein DFJ74DRAFT_708198 [Hyaloraphidium curvatum]|nr:hypothetical protein DFJ74DRAFT_708198 [Hyaloraphidium curvatum]